MAKQLTAHAEQRRPKRKVVRELKKTQARHEKAERQVGKLRMRLERAEAKLAQRAQRLLLVQAKLHPVDDHVEPAPEDQDGAGQQAPDEEALPVMVTAAAPTANGDARASQSLGATPRRARPPRARAKRRPLTGPAGK